VFSIHILLSFSETRNWRKEFVGKVNEEVTYLEALCSSDEVIFVDIRRILDAVNCNYFSKVKDF